MDSMGKKHKLGPVQAREGYLQVSVPNLTAPLEVQIHFAVTGSKMPLLLWWRNAKESGQTEANQHLDIGSSSSVNWLLLW